MYSFKVTVSGLETIDIDVQKETANIEKKIPSALRVVGAEMIANLQEHIKNDWYSQYKPKKYKRRTDDPSLGTPIGSEEYMDAQVENNTLTFTYEPRGEHKYKGWHNRDNDDLINFLQVGTEYMPPRPFWNNFVQDQRDSGIMNAFSQGMRPYNVIREGIGIDVLFDIGESELNEESYVVSSSDDDSDELPF
jgi:hypothetical protein